MLSPHVLWFVVMFSVVRMERALCGHCLCSTGPMPRLERTAGYSTVTYLAATSLLQACERMITALLVWHTVICSTPSLLQPHRLWHKLVLICFRAMCLRIILSFQPVYNHSFIVSPKKSLSKFSVVENKVKPVCCPRGKTRISPVNLYFSLFLTIYAKLLQVTKADVLWRAGSNAAMHD